MGMGVAAASPAGLCIGDPMGFVEITCPSLLLPRSHEFQHSFHSTSRGAALGLHTHILVIDLEQEAPKPPQTLAFLPSLVAHLSPPPTSTPVRSLQLLSSSILPSREV